MQLRIYILCWDAIVPQLGLRICRALSGSPEKGNAGLVDLLLGTNLYSQGAFVILAVIKAIYLATFGQD
jgi:hypothetical protein